MAMLAVLAALSFIAGIALIASGSKQRRLARDWRPPVTLPTARLEDGTPIEVKLPRGPSRGIGRTVFGVIVMIAGPLFFGFLYVVSSLLSDGGGFQMGRPLRARRDRRPLLPRLDVGAYAEDGTHPAALPLLERHRAGRHWLAAARHEHASVPAFEQLAVQVGALGGSTELVARCHAAATDERRHATRCYTLARGYTGLPWRPPHRKDGIPAVPILAADPVTIGVESFVDGAIGEALAAELAGAGAARATDPVIADSLAMIARDEARHAELAWDVIALCITRGGDPVRAAIAAAAAAPVAVPDAGPTGLARAEVEAIAATIAAAARARLAHLAQA